MKTICCGQIIFEEQLYAFSIKNITKFTELRSSEFEFYIHFFKN